MLGPRLSACPSPSNLRTLDGSLFLSTLSMSLGFQSFHMHCVVVSSCIDVRLSFVDQLSATQGKTLALSSDSHVIGLHPGKSAMIKKRSRPQPRVREISPEVEEASNNETGEKSGEEKLE